MHMIIWSYMWLLSYVQNMIYIFNIPDSLDSFQKDKILISQMQNNLLQI